MTRRVLPHSSGEFKYIYIYIYKISATTQQIPLGIFITISFVPQDVALIR